MWEFVTADETMDDWKTLFTVIDRPDALTSDQLDRVAEGILSDYRSRGARILASGGTDRYLVVAFDEPAKNRCELNFVKIELGSPEAVVTTYRVRITDAGDYRTAANEFMNRNAAEIGRALGALPLPDIRTLPRRF